MPLSGHPEPKPTSLDPIAVTSLPFASSTPPLPHATPAPATPAAVNSAADLMAKGPAQPPSVPLSVIIVTHNHAPFIGRCLAAVVPEVERLGGEVLLVDNRSSDDSAAIARRYPTVQLLINRTRRGFSANNNLGMALAKGRYILLLNPDTEVQPGALATLLTFMDEHPNVGLCGAQLLFPDGTVQPSPRRFPNLGSVIARRTPLRHFLRQSSLNQHHLMLDADHTQIRPVDWLLGACLLIRREILTTVGPLDEGYFLYVEDIDWARRIHAAHWQVYYVPTAQIIHHHLAVSDKKLLSRHMGFHVASMIRYARKFMVPALPGLKISSQRMDLWQRVRSHYSPEAPAPRPLNLPFWEAAD
jgi:N-acetylglucosaminyl-diphospho-decaprenol L-rhamnosyltransferase